MRAGYIIAAHYWDVYCILHIVYIQISIHTQMYLYIEAFGVFFSSLNGYTPEICTRNVDVDAEFLPAEPVLILFLCPS